MSHRPTTILALLSLSISFSLGNYVVLERLPTDRVDGYAVLIEKTYRILKDISLLCLGSSGNLKLAFDVGYAIGKMLKDKGISAYVFSPIDTLDRSDPDPLNRISSSPYISAKVIEYLSEGLSAAGVLPVLDGRSIDERLVKVLVMKNLTLPVFVESEFQVEKLKKLGYESLIFTRTSGRKIVLRWEGVINVEIESLRKEVLKRSIVMLNPRGEGISINDPFSRSKVLIFSSEDWLLKLAEDVESGRDPATGRKTW